MSPRFDEQPDFFALSGWQETDDDHPPDGGEPAYRAVYKTLRLVVPSVDLSWPNLWIRFAHGTVKRGGAEIRNAQAGRRPRQWFLLEQGGLVQRGEHLEFRSLPNMLFELGGWENEVPDAWYVEFVLLTRESTPARRLAEGRRRLASIKTMLDLHFGQRVLGVPLTEELGERHSDGHWARSLNSDSLGAESMVPVNGIGMDDMAAFAGGPLDAFISRSPRDNRRISLACDWYWTAVHNDDAVTSYLQLWFVVEALLMPDTTNIAPVKARLADVLGGSAAEWGSVVGRHFGRRSRLAHGEDERSVADEVLRELRMLVEILLAAELSVDPPPHADELQALLQRPR